MEVSMAAVLLAAGMTLTVQVLAWSATERRSADRRQVALREAANALERLSIDLEAAITLSEHADRILPEGSIEIERNEEAEGPPLTRLAVVVRYQDRGMPAAPVRLTTWLARPGNVLEEGR